MIFSTDDQPQTRRSPVAVCGLLIAVVALFVTSCSFDIEIGGDSVKGEGDIVAQTYDVDSFDSARIEDSFDATIEVGPDVSVLVQAHENLFDHIVVEVQGNALVAKARDDADLNGVTNITITMPSLVDLDVSGVSSTKVLGAINTEKLNLDVRGASEVSFDRVNALEVDASVAGASDVTLDDVTSETIALKIAGASDVEMNGQASAASIDVSGASDVKFGQLAIDEVSVSIAGTSDVDVRRAQTVSGAMSGSSSLRVGDEALVNVDVSGLSDIQTG